MKKVAFLLFAPLIFTTTLYSQKIADGDSNRMGKNYIGVELGGTGLSYSLSYERNLSIKENLIQSLKIGVSKSFFDGVDQYFIPVDYTAYFGKGNFQFFGGLGVTILLSPSAFPSNARDRSDYKQLYQTNPSLALNKYGTTRYELPADIAYTLRAGVRIGAKRRFTYFAYMNCFYIRLTMDYYFQPLWLSAGLSMKISK